MDTRPTLSRRAFVARAGLSFAAIVAVGLSPMAAAAAGTRLGWPSFKAGPDYADFTGAIAKMRKNTNASDPASWFYWANVHEAQCPHGVPYFLAWHRGYIWLFEQKLREISGNAKLLLPYWDYYRDPNLPTEFTDTTAGNPLFHARTNTNVRNALSLAPFAPALVNFQRGQPNAFEPSVESMPHNQVHNLIGGIMPTMQSPQDPIFWVHHANIDRLWAAWIRAGAGRHQPAETDAYWRDTFAYGAGVTMPRVQTYDTDRLGYDYEDEKMPTNIPTATLPRRPAPKRYGTWRAPPDDPRTLGGVAEVVLNEESTSVVIAVPDSGTSALRGHVDRDAKTPDAFSDVSIALDRVRLTGDAAEGGFFYKVYLNLPSQAGKGREEDHLLGTLGPFEINGAAHHGKAADGVDFAFPISDRLKAQAFDFNDDLTVSFVRVDGEQSADGDVIAVGAVRIVVSPKP